MKRLLVTGLLAVVLGLAASPSRALADDYDDTQSHPLRVAAYLVYPVGYTAEWLIFRPFHYIVSRPYLDRIFGHESHEEIGY